MFKRLLYIIVPFVVIVSCKRTYLPSKGIKENSDTVEIKLVFDSCINVRKTNMVDIYFSVNNKSHQSFRFEILNFSFGKLLDNSGNEVERITIIEPIRESAQKIYNVKPNEEKEIKISLNYFHQFLFSKNGTYVIKDSRYKINSREQIYLKDEKINICNGDNPK